MNWDDNFAKDIEAELGKRVERAAIYLTNVIKKKLNKGQAYKITKGANGRHYRGLEPSAPGEAPKKVRGDLQRSITYQMDNDKLGARVGTNLIVGFFLEMGTSKMAPRPFLRSTLIEEQAKIEQILGAG